jgi:hypothetical protein
MRTRWETVVELRAWTSDMALAALAAGIEVAPDNGFTDEPTTVAMVVEADSPDRARRPRPRHARELRCASGYCRVP